MTESKTAPGGWEANVRRQTLRLALWTGAWLVTMAIATFGPRFIWTGNRTMTVFGIALNLLVGVGMIVANRNHLRSLDEMHQKIQLEAMALTLGVGLIAGLSYSLLDVTNVVAFDAEISHLVILMGLTYGAGLFLGVRKYR